MARTLNPVAHAVRRDAFLDAAQALITTKGYEALSIQDVIDAVGASKGAFYHYFESKGALLDAVVARMVEGGLAAVEPVVADPTLSATAKLAAFASGIARFKTERREFLLALIEVWLSDDNAVVREHFRRRARSALAATIRQIIRQGIAEGSFHVEDPETSAEVFLSLLLGLNEIATELYVARQAGRISFDEVERRFAAYRRAFDRILGAAAGTMTFGDPALIREWYGDAVAHSDVA